MHHILLLEIGYHCSYAEGDEEIVSYLLYCFDEKLVGLTLRFLNEQIVKQDWVMYQHIADFMLKCRRRMRAEGSALVDFLRILSNVLINEFNCPAVAEQIYLQLFHSQMHHFLYPHLLLELAFLLCKLINIKEHRYTEEFAHIALRCL